MCCPTDRRGDVARDGALRLPGNSGPRPLTGPPATARPCDRNRPGGLFRGTRPGRAPRRPRTPRPLAPAAVCVSLPQRRQGDRSIQPALGQRRRDRAPDRGLIRTLRTHGALRSAPGHTPGVNDPNSPLLRPPRRYWSETTARQPPGRRPFVLPRRAVRTRPVLRCRKRLAAAPAAL